ncbi:MAG: hypothetical protein KTR16_02615 [Acidiferrobacterales bacterium]|nr:hypothetical protein [Acidiferrobacterales bacterium]
MSIARKHRTHDLQASELLVQTREKQWIIPNSAIIMKALLMDQTLGPRDFKFDCDSDCQLFIRRLLILALEDEHRNRQPSPLAKLAQGLIQETIRKLSTDVHYHDQN